MSKHYGLLVPPKNKTTETAVLQRSSVFGNDSDSNDESDRPTGLKTAPKRQDRLIQEKAIEQDPTVYQYDEIYDEMDKRRTESKLSRKDLDKKPKYINKLLQSADRRKRENERRIERQVQKEREAEGEMYKDKESFVTSAYRQKLEELRQLEEQEKREEYLESIGDVTKQGNLDGFYRHLYDQKVLFEEKIKEEPSTPKDDAVEKRSDNEYHEIEEKRCEKVSKSNIRKRKYRKRDESESEEEVKDEEPEKKLQTHLPSNLDADSDFSIDSSDSEEEDKIPKTEEVPKPIEDADKNTKEEDIDKKEDIKQPIKSENKDAKENEKKEVEEPKEKKSKVDIWKKRTVGKVFEEAVKRYFERKAQREAGTFSRF